MVFISLVPTIYDKAHLTYINENLQNLRKYNKWNPYLLKSQRTFIIVHLLLIFAKWR